MTMTATGWTDLAVTFLLRSTESLPLSASPLYPSREEVLLFSVSAMTRTSRGGEEAKTQNSRLKNYAALIFLKKWATLKQFIIHPSHTRVFSVERDDPGTVIYGTLFSGKGKFCEWVDREA